MRSSIAPSAVLRPGSDTGSIRGERTSEHNSSRSE